MRVVIAGGGFCGSMVAKELQHRKDIEVTLIDKKDHFEYYPSLPKLITDPGYHQKITKPYSRFLEDVELIEEEEVIGITPEFVSTRKRKVDFDVSVISLGAEYPIYLDNEENVFTIRSGKEVKELSKRVERANRLLIVGGGLIGTEAAAELASKTEKDVTLVHSHGRLIERNPRMASYLAQKYLEKSGVELILGEKVKDRDDDTYITDEGRKIQAEVCIWSTGLTYDEDLYRELDPSTIADDGSLKVNDHLQVKGYPNVFAGGDITHIDEEKTGHNADSHSRVISENITRMRDGRSLKKYSEVKFPLLISLGDINGIVSFPPLGIPGPIPAFMKYLLEKGALWRL